MADRSSVYTAKEAQAAIEAFYAVPEPCTPGMYVEAILRSIGMRPAQPITPIYGVMSTAPHDRDIVLRTPKRGDVRAVWWNSWYDTSDPHPWAWREARADQSVGEPVPEADGWRELPL